MREIEALLFDFDGTLLNSIWLSYLATCRMFREAGCREPTFDEYWTHCHHPFHLFYQERGVRMTEEAIWERFLQLADFGRAQFFEDVAVVLPKLKERGVSLGLISCHRHEPLVNHCRKHGVLDYFDLGVTGGLGDKSEEICRVATYTEGVQRFGYVGDFPQDMRQAVKAGVIPVGITRGYRTAEQLRRAGAKYVIEHLHELLLYVAE